MNPFTLYLPCYAPGTVAERPWWRFSVVASNPGTTLSRFTRSDGAVLDGDAYREDGYWGKPPPEWLAEQARRRASFIADHIAAIDAYDAAHPLPVPPVLLGQVWWTGGRYVFGLPGEGVGGHWCLVWGPLAPWAPAGWRP